MVCGELHIIPYLVLDQNANDNAYSIPSRHEFWNVDHKRVMLGIYLCYNKFSHLWVTPQHYPEHDTFFLSIFFPWIFFLIFLDQWHHFGGVFLPENFWIPELNIYIFFPVPVCILICESNLTDPGSWTLDINWYIYITLINSIKSINHFFPMPRCTYTTINYNGVILWHNWHKVQCRGTSVFFITTISVFPYCI